MFRSSLAREISMWIFAEHGCQSRLASVTVPRRTPALGG
jgi:hypothetical protein